MPNDDTTSHDRAATDDTASDDTATGDEAGRDPSAPGTAVWRADHDRVTSGDVESPEPYGPERDTVRPAQDRPRRTTRGRPTSDAQGISD